MGGLGSLLLALIHWILDILTSLSLQLTLTKRRLAQEVDWAKLRSKFAWAKSKNEASHDKPLPEQIEESTATLAKRPSHVAFIFLEEALSLPDVARIAFFAICAGISNVSLYDLGGRLKSGQVELLRALQRTQRAFLATPTPSPALLKRIHWHSHNRGEAEEAESSHGNGRNGRSQVGSGDAHGHAHGHAQRDVHISLLSAEDGRPDIVHTAVTLAKRVRSHALSPAHIDEDLITASLTANRGMPDPDLSVQFGPAKSNMGFLPWQTRLTEMHRIESHLYLGWPDLLGVLQDYSKCGQRFGK